MFHGKTEIFFNKNVKNKDIKKLKTKLRFSQFLTDTKKKISQKERQKAQED